MAQIMKPETGHVSLTASPVECLADRITAHRAAITADEYPLGPCPGSQVIGQHRQHVRRHGHIRLPASVLGSASKAARLFSSSSTRLRRTVT
jgi:hypothetical protein